jgi:hypothetical protein
MVVHGELEHGMVVQSVTLLLGGRTWADAVVCNPATVR